MQQNLPISDQPEPAPHFARWGSMPLNQCFEVDGQSGLDRLPVFERVSTANLGLGANPNFDMVVRNPGPGMPLPVPVAMVSKTYRILQHREILERVLDYAAKRTGSAPGKAMVSTTPNGERMTMRMDLGREWACRPDGRDVRLEILCRNSVDGSSALRLHLGWFRLVCSNGLVVGVTLGRVRMVHAKHADMDLAFKALEQQIEIAKTERDNLENWTRKSVSIAAIQAWVDSVVAEKWNTLAAARVWHICRSGHDVKFTPPFEKAPPTQRKVKVVAPVPGAPSTASTLYDVAQSLSWVASRRSDLDESETHQRDIGRLLEQLRNG